MPLFTELFREDDIHGHLPNGQMRSLYNLYRSEREGLDDPGSLPHIADIAQDDFTGLGPWIIQVSVQDDDDYLYEHFGGEIARAMGFSMIGKLVSNGHGRPYAFFKKCYDQIASTRRPMLSHSSAVLTPSVASWKRLLMPCCDDVGRLHIIAALHPIPWSDSMIHALLRVMDVPIVIVKMIRNQGADVIDGQILQLNDTARSTFNVSSRRHLYLSDCAPELLANECRNVLIGAYSTNKTLEHSEPFKVADQSFSGMTATHCGDGAVLVFHKEAQEASIKPAQVAELA